MADRALTAAQREALSYLKHFGRFHDSWCDPSSGGGHHGATLAALVRRGLAERQPQDGYSYYRITPAGRAALAAAEEEP